MAFESSDRPALERRLVRALLVAIVVVAIALVATAAFGWTLVEAPGFGITPDPAGTLPF
jgi:hypothetical protein